MRVLHVFADCNLSLHFKKVYAYVPQVPRESRKETLGEGPGRGHAGAPVGFLVVANFSRFKIRIFWPRLL